jgi:sugar lactone lactonase YvrE
MTARLLSGLLLLAPLTLPRATAAEGDWPPRPLRIASKVSGHIHPAACLSRNGTVVVVFSQSDFRDLRLTRSADRGKIWSTPVPFPGTEKLAIYPGSLTALGDGRVVHAWNTWYRGDNGQKSRFVQFSVSGDEGKTWSAPKSLAKNAKAESIIRHPFVELSDGKWLFSLSDRTVAYDPKTGEESAFGGRTHGLVPIVRTAKGTLVSGAGLRSTDGGKTWKKVSPFPKIGENGWRFEMVALDNGWLVAGEVLGPGTGGDRWRFVVSRDDGKNWAFDDAVTFYDPGRPISGRACPRTVQLDKNTLGTVFYDVDARQPGGPGVFFIRASLTRLAGPARAEAPVGELAKRLAGVKFERYAEAPGYSEGPTWRNGELFFCSGALMRVDAAKKAHPYLEINPAGTVLRADGHILICDNKHRALLDLAPDGKVGVVVEQFGMQRLRSLNDLTVDARGNVYWTDPEGSSLKSPVGSIFRVRPDGRVDRVATGLAFPNGLDVDPAGKFLYVIESQSKKILRYPVPADDELLGKPEVFFDLGGSGGDGCVFDAAGNFWVADFHRPETGKGRITVLSPAGKVLAHLPVPAQVVSNITFGGPDNDEIFCTTGGPPGVFRAKVGVKGFPGHPGKCLPIVRYLNEVPLRPHPDAATLRKIAKIAEGRPDGTAKKQLKALVAGLTDAKVRGDTEKLLPVLERAAARHAADRLLLAEIRRLGGKATTENTGPVWLRSITGDRALPVFERIVEIELNERSDGHKAPVPKKLSDRVTDDWLKRLAGQDRLRRLELSGTAVTSAGLAHLKGLTGLEWLNVCLTAVDDRGLEHLAGLTRMRRMVVCSSKITGSGFDHLQGMKQIESINLHSSPASDEGLRAIGKLTSLRRLEIVHTNVTDKGLKHLAGLVNLRQLHVASHDTTEAALPFLSKLTALEQLDVYERAASNATLEQAGKLPRLRSLMLAVGTFDDDGVRHLAGLTGLEELWLGSNKATDRAIEHLAGLRKLRKLHLGGTRISAAGRQRLGKLLPRAVISD